ncbi:MAG: Nif3-like dinuclear metal center hexameric protein [Planctomycetota bacterium]
MRLDHVCQTLASIAPLKLAEDWDNVGLLIGDRQAEITRVLTCLTITPGVVDEAIDGRVDLIVSHHPLPFKPLAKINTDTIPSQLVWRLCRAGVAVYSAHTAYDSATGGINDQWAQRLGLQNVRPMLPFESTSAAIDPAKCDGAGRIGELSKPVSARDLLRRAARCCGATRPRLAGDPNAMVQRIGIGCGSGGSFLAAARRAGCDGLLTGEATFHICLEAENTGISLWMVGHFASERFAMETLATRLAAGLREFDSTWAGDVTPSQRDRDPIAVDPNPHTP